MFYRSLISTLHVMRENNSSHVSIYIGAIITEYTLEENNYIQM